MAKVKIHEGESIEKALRRFNRQVLEEGIVDEVKDRAYYEKPSVTKRREEANKKLKIKIARRRASR